jgi:FtrD-like iron-sulfur protein
MWDAFAVAFQVALEGAIAAALGVALLRPSALRRLAAPFAAAVPVGLAIGLAAGARAGGALPDLAPSLHRTEQLFALALAALALLAAGRSADALAARPLARWAAEAATLAAGLLVLLPEGAFLAGRLGELAVLRGGAAPIRLAAAGGVALAAALGAAAAALWVRAGVGRFVGPSAALALLLALELGGIAATAVDAHTLPLAVTAGISRAVHDAVHLVFVVLQVPDHAFLEDWAYQLILRFLEPAVHAALAAAVVAAPLAAAWRAFLRRPPPVPAATARAPERRLARARFLRESRLGALPFAAAVLLACASIWSARAQGDELYDPVPEPVVDDGAGTIVVPLGGPLAGADDRMRKWVYSAGGRAVTFFTVRRPDGSLAAALDLCEICQPRGYAQMGAGYVFCKYCKTPIPVVTVGQPGGCNPIPIPGAILSGSILRLPREAVVAAWERAMAEKR